MFCAQNSLKFATAWLDCLWYCERFLELLKSSAPRDQASVAWITMLHLRPSFLLSSEPSSRRRAVDRFYKKAQRMLSKSMSLRKITEWIKFVHCIRTVKNPKLIEIDSDKKTIVNHYQMTKQIENNGWTSFYFLRSEFDGESEFRFWFNRMVRRMVGLQLVIPVSYVESDLNLKWTQTFGSCRVGPGLLEYLWTDLLFGLCFRTVGLVLTALQTAPNARSGGNSPHKYLSEPGPTVCDRSFCVDSDFEV